jgi:hypothetical protein
MLDTATFTLEWDVAEAALAAPVAAALAADPAPRRTAVRDRALAWCADDASDLQVGLHHSVRRAGGACTIEALPVRHLYRLLGFDETHPFRWRLEHKLVHALVLNHFCPGAMPVTCGLSSVAARCAETGVDTLRDVLAGSFVKRALGYGSSPENSAELQAVLGELTAEAAPARPAALCDERWIVQRRVDACREYRVHTLEARVVDDLTHVRFGNRATAAERRRPNEYVQDLLTKLPDAFVSGTLCGWDVAEGANGALQVIEVNFSGFHPVFGRGFQCSGFFQHPSAGPALVARLMRFIQEQYGVSWRFRPAVTAPADVAALYDWIARWCDTLLLSSQILRLATSVDEWPSPAAAADRYAPSHSTLAAVARRWGTVAGYLD